MRCCFGCKSDPQTDFLEQLLHDRLQTASANVLSLILTRAAKFAMASMASSVKSIVTPSVSIIAWYCLIKLLRLSQDSLKSSTVKESNIDANGSAPEVRESNRKVWKRGTHRRQ